MLWRWAAVASFLAATIVVVASLAVMRRSGALNGAPRPLVAAADELLGDKAPGVVREDLGMHGADGWRVRVAVETKEFPVEARSLAGGLMRHGDDTYDIVDNQAAADGVVELIVRREIGRRLRFPTAAAVTLYEDDFKRPPRNPGGEPVLRVRPDDPMVLNDVKRYLGSRGDQLAGGRFAEAFIDVDFETLKQYGGKLPAKNHWNARSTEWIDDPQVKLDGEKPHRESAKFERATFWTAYLGLAYQHGRDADFDPDDVRAADAGRAPTGVTGELYGFVRNSFVFVESVWDHWTAAVQLADDDPNRARSKSAEAQLGRVVAQQIGRQLGLSESHGVMDPNSHRLEEAQFEFSAEQLKAIRMAKQPGGAKPVQGR